MLVKSDEGSLTEESDDDNMEEIVLSSGEDTDSDIEVLSVEEADVKILEWIKAEKAVEEVVKVDEDEHEERRKRRVKKKPERLKDVEFIDKRYSTLCKFHVLMLHNTLLLRNIFSGSITGVLFPVPRRTWKEVRPTCESDERESKCECLTPTLPMRKCDTPLFF